MTTKKKEFVIPEVPHFCDYEHTSITSKPTDIKLGMVYFSHYGLVRPLERRRNVFRVERFDALTGEWIEMNKQMIACLALSWYTDLNREWILADREISLKREAEIKRQTARNKRKADQRDREMARLEALGAKVNSFDFYKNHSNSEMVYLTLTSSQYSKLKRLLAKAGEA